MSNAEIEERLSSLTVATFSLDDFAEELVRVKRKHVEQNDQTNAKQLWIYLLILDIHKMYRDAFGSLQEKRYYNAWCNLEKIEIALGSLKRHFSYNKNQFFIWHIERAVKNLQVIFPYRLFASSEIIKKKKKCSICDQTVSIRNSCGHIVGEIYDGEMCHRIVTEAEVVGISLVKNPNNKYAVMFLKNEQNGETVDQYNYDTIDYLLDLLSSPYEIWDLEVTQRKVSRDEFPKLGRNDPCNCNSGKKFKRCCELLIGTIMPNYQFIIKNPSPKAMLMDKAKKKFITENNTTRKI